MNTSLKETFYLEYSDGKKTQNSYDRAASARRMYNRLVKEAKQNFMLGKLKQHNKDQNKFWNEIKKLIPKMNNREVKEVINPTTGNICSGKEANNLMNDYFINIGEQLANTLQPSKFKSIIPNRM